MRQVIGVVGKGFALAVISLVVGAGQVFPVDWQSVAKEAKAKSAQFESEIKDMTILQQMTMISPQGEMSSKMRVFRKGKRFRTETRIPVPARSGMPGEMDEMETTVIYDGKEGWMISPFLGKQRLSEEEVQQYQSERNIWDIIGDNAKVTGTEKIGKRDCYVVETTGEGDFPFTRIWLDKNTLNVVKAERKKPEEPTTLLQNYDFRKIKDDWEMPFKTEIYLGGTLMSSTVVDSLQVNKGLADELFDSGEMEVEDSEVDDIIRKIIQQEKEGED
jgi:outer membrane lipoprotein-sorting protein